MSIDRIHGDIVIICDGCDETYEAGTDDFHEALAEAKTAGWRSVKVLDLQWQHYCDTCEAPEPMISRDILMGG